MRDYGFIYRAKLLKEIEQMIKDAKATWVKNFEKDNFKMRIS